MSRSFSKVMGKNIEASYSVNRYKHSITTVLNFLEGVSYLVILGVSGALLITTNNISPVSYTHLSNCSLALTSVLDKVCILS